APCRARADRRRRPSSRRRPVVAGANGSRTLHEHCLDEDLGHRSSAHTGRVDVFTTGAGLGLVALLVWGLPAALRRMDASSWPRQMMVLLAAHSMQLGLPGSF